MKLEIKELSKTYGKGLRRKAGYGKRSGEAASKDVRLWRGRDASAKSGKRALDAFRRCSRLAYMGFWGQTARENRR